MRIANLHGRLVLLTTSGALDVHEASEGRFPSDPQEVYTDWEAFRSWARNQDPAPPAETSPEEYGLPVPAPRQIFAIGLNYIDHAMESGVEPPEVPPVFTKFASSLTGPSGEIVLPGETVDWEVELVAVIGRGGRGIPAGQAWEHIAGLAVGQDLSERTVQLRPPSPQFSLGKSYAGFGPVGPVVVSPDEFADPDDLEVVCRVNGEVVQHARTSSMIFSIPQLVEHLSGVAELLPGDIIFTGTPAGVGLGCTPPSYLRAGDVLETRIAGIGTMRHTMVRGAAG
ncbi:fumarylacetoacetate hydrolase family protein [Sediminivirga luteola]|jgi:2-keto-4-pentenoate hydratase/2-oxohepta-3-ene-1,7-dioic acid hydratase in catechol pathway|uniref:Fumarylacetoacetate hydrolase n=1 Tax=Sediminivirga luteola TaxID=1774748 RepID=A0A8J2XJY7_9MICO|nr:fumarylacetoacetate hydrolase family protein [Sediminivirga luteola]GGA10141.1 fumarylacetoacetate hydrolase [Sediminivirga luteola]